MAKLYFYYSAMNAGKTTTLLQSAYNYRERGMRTLILTPRLDTRAERVPSSAPALVPDGIKQGHPRPEGEDKTKRSDAADAAMGAVASRIGLRADALRFSRADDLRAIAEADIKAHGKLDCVLVDEAQFLTRAQVWQLSEVVDALDIPVLAYGLRTDFRGELFEGSQHLLAWADNLVEIKTICHTGKKATMVVRVDEHGRAVTDGPQVEIGGNERYVSVSRPEFKKIMSGRGRVELQQPVLPLDARRESHQ